MHMKRPIAVRQYCTLILFLVTSLLYGCASSGAMMDAGRLTIDKVVSDHADIGTVYIHKTREGVDLAGKVKFKRAVMGVSRDRLHITVIGPTGKLLYATYTNYYRYGKPIKKSDMFNFAMMIPVNMPKGSIVRLENDERM